MDHKDIRWQQRFQNFLNALTLLEDAVSLGSVRELSKLEEQGLIQSFEFTHELAWNILKDYLEYQGNYEITGSRDASREAFKMGLVTDGEGWMAMIKSRNQSSHTYNNEVAKEIRKMICEKYYPLFVAFKSKMTTLLKP